MTSSFLVATRQRTPVSDYPSSAGSPRSDMAVETPPALSPARNADKPLDEHEYDPQLLAEGGGLPDELWSQSGFGNGDTSEPGFIMASPMHPVHKFNAGPVTELAPPIVLTPQRHYGHGLSVTSHQASPMQHATFGAGNSPLGLAAAPSPARVVSIPPMFARTPLQRTVSSSSAPASFHVTPVKPGNISWTSIDQLNGAAATGAPGLYSNQQAAFTRPNDFFNPPAKLEHAIPQRLEAAPLLRTPDNPMPTINVSDSFPQWAPALPYDDWEEEADHESVAGESVDMGGTPYPAHLSMYSFTPSRYVPSPSYGTYAPAAPHGTSVYDPTGAYTELAKDMFSSPGAPAYPSSLNTGPYAVSSRGATSPLSEDEEEYTPSPTRKRRHTKAKPTARRTTQPVLEPEPEPGRTSQLLYTCDTPRPKGTIQRCLTCGTIRRKDSLAFRASTLYRGKINCNKCGIHENTYRQSRPTSEGDPWHWNSPEDVARRAGMPVPDDYGVAPVRPARPGGRRAPLQPRRRKSPST